MASRTIIDGRAFAQRRTKAFRAFVKQAPPAAAVLVSRPEDVSYLSGFTGEDSYLLMGKGWAMLVTDGRFTEQAQGECPGLEILTRTSGVAKTIAQQLKARKAPRLAVQSEHLTMRAAATIEDLLGKGRLVGAADVVIAQRAVKDAAEVAVITKAVRVAERAFKELLAGGLASFVGRSEGQIAAELDHRMRMLGASGPSFETIVAAGPHGSLCHYRPGSRRVRRGEPVLIDWGAKVAGYCSDLTRVVFTATIPPKLGEVYQVVSRAQQAGIQAVRPGISGAKADQAARDVIANAGYGERFVHSLGHGIGRMIHELPVLSSLSKAPLRAGMVVTVEPGVYLPGIGGIRIEDDVLVTDTGHRRLSTLSRDIRAMVLTK